MRKNTVFAVAVVMVLGLSQVAYAKYVSGFKVIKVTETQVVIQKGEAEPVTVEVKSGKLEVDDEVKYDAEEQKVMKVRRRTQIVGC